MRLLYTPGMAIVEKHAPGSFCWIELATTDQAAAKNFYSSLFGWTANDFPMGPGDFYTIFRLEGRDAAAGATLRPEPRAMGVPPHWMLYIETADVDEAAKKATELGGKVLAGPFDVMDVGRMAVIQDPTGAVFTGWTAKSHSGIGIAGVPNTFCWADLNTPDPARAKQFYSALLGWKISAGEHDKSGYEHIQNGDTMIGGIPPLRPESAHIPPHWLVYFQVADVDATTGKAKELGATMHLEPMSMEGVGRFAVIGDPQGAAFAIFKSAR
jgi:predicted enzyme related to lactoylglutathione lyase